MTVKTIVNAGFYRISQRNARNRNGRQIMNVQGMEFDKPFDQIMGKDVWSHPKAPPSGDGWTVQGWYWVNKEQQVKS